MCLWIINYQAGQVVHQPLVQLVGFDCIYHESLLVNQIYSWPIVQGLFKIYLELKPGENQIHLSTATSELTFILIYQPLETSLFTIRLGSLSFPNQNNVSLQHIAQQFVFLTKLVRCAFDEILFKQFGYARSLLFEIEKQFHHINMSEDDFQDKQNSEEIFKVIYRRMIRTDFAPNTSMKLILHSNIAPNLAFAYTFKDVIVINLPEHFTDLPSSFDEFVQILNTNKADSIFYMVGAYLHELGHLFGLEHDHSSIETIMSSSKDFIESGRDFFLATPRLCSILFNHQCSCYRTPTMQNSSSSYSNGVFNKNSQYFQSKCQSDIYCIFPVKFERQQLSHPCVCHRQFQFTLAQGQRLIKILAGS